MSDRITPIGLATSVLGKLIVELRSDTAVHAIVADRVYGKRPAPDAVRPYVLVSRIGPRRRFARAAYYVDRVAIDAVGPAGSATGAQTATTLANAISDCLHQKGYRQSSAGVAIFASYEDLGSQAFDDPDTRDPVERSIYIYSAPTAQAV